MERYKQNTLDAEEKRKARLAAWNAKLERKAALQSQMAQRQEERAAPEMELARPEPTYQEIPDRPKISLAALMRENTDIAAAMGGRSNIVSISYAEAKRQLPTAAVHKKRRMKLKRTQIVVKTPQVMRAEMEERKARMQRGLAVEDSEENSAEAMELS